MKKKRKSKKKEKWISIIHRLLRLFLLVLVLLLFFFIVYLIRFEFFLRRSSTELDENDKRIDFFSFLFEGRERKKNVFEFPFFQIQSEKKKKV